MRQINGKWKIKNRKWIIMRKCNACKNQVIDFDHKDPSLAKYLTSWGKIKSSKETRLCTKHQRNLTRALKRARFLALIPYTNR